jgi:hypothetical protein
MITKRMPARMARWSRSGVKAANRGRVSLEAIAFRPGPSGIGAARSRTPKRVRGVDCGAAMFVPVRVAGEAPVPVMEIVLNGGDRLHVRAGAAADVVQAAVAALRSRC